MARAKKPRLVECDGTLYIRYQDLAIEPLIVLCDGLQITTFKDDRSKRWYTTIDNAITWHRREVAHGATDLRAKALDALIEIKRKFDAGDKQ